MRHIFMSVLATFVLVGTASADTIYRWIDAGGQAHYSDRPREGAEVVELAPASSFRMPSAARSGAAATGGESGTAAVPAYESLVISSPTEEQTVWNTGGVITVTVSPTPALQSGHGIRLYYDGQLLQDQPLQTTSLQLSEVYRGTHTLSAEVVNSAGQVLISSPTVTFFYRQTAGGNRAAGGNRPAGSNRTQR